MGIRGILYDIEGVSHVEANVEAHVVTITFDKTKTSAAKMSEALGKGGHPVIGEPQFLK